MASTKAESATKAIFINLSDTDGIALYKKISMFRAEQDISWKVLVLESIANTVKDSNSKLSNEVFDYLGKL